MFYKCSERTRARFSHTHTHTNHVVWKMPPDNHMQLVFALIVERYVIVVDGSVYYMKFFLSGCDCFLTNSVCVCVCGELWTLTAKVRLSLLSVICLIFFFCWIIWTKYIQWLSFNNDRIWAQWHHTKKKTKKQTKSK